MFVSGPCVSLCLFVALVVFLLFLEILGMRGSGSCSCMMIYAFSASGGNISFPIRSGPCLFGCSEFSVSAKCASSSFSSCSIAW